MIPPGRTKVWNALRRCSPRELKNYCEAVVAGRRESFGIHQEVLRGIACRAKESADGQLVVDDTHVNAALDELLGETSPLRGCCWAVTRTNRRLLLDQRMGLIRTDRTCRIASPGNIATASSNAVRRGTATRQARPARPRWEAAMYRWSPVRRRPRRSPEIL